MGKPPAIGFIARKKYRAATAAEYAREEMALNLDFLPLNKNVRILNSHDCGIFALEKPAGTTSHPNSRGLVAAKRAMLLADYEICGECYFVKMPDGTRKKISLINRLDSPTSGVVLCSTNETIARAVHRAFSSIAEKTYFALVFGEIPDKVVWQDYIWVRMGSGAPLRSFVYSHKDPYSDFAETAVEKIRGNKNVSLVKFSPHTGKTHQIRAQSAYHRFPVIGDKTYGDFELNRKVEKILGAESRMFLHSETTKIDFEFNGEDIEFSATSPLPKSFSSALNLLLAQ
ncbi:MAG: pseudouridine synthase [Opitutae bacterium]|nr:pseudouridine synthase [Opitutae bacterium]